MSVAAASLVVAIALTAFAGANWLWLRADADAPREHLSALADCALVALAVHLLALIASGTTSPGAYGLTVVVACAAAALRRAPTAPEDARVRAGAAVGRAPTAPEDAPVRAGAAMRRAPTAPVDASAAVGRAPTAHEDASAAAAPRERVSPRRASLWSDPARGHLSPHSGDK